MIIEKYCLFLLLLLVVNLDNHPCQCINFALNCIIINLERSCKVFPIYSSVLFMHDGWEFVRDQNWKDTRRLFIILFMTRLLGWKMIWKIIWSVRRISQRKDDIALRSKFVKLFIIRFLYKCGVCSYPCRFKGGFWVSMSMANQELNIYFSNGTRENKSATMV